MNDVVSRGNMRTQREDVDAALDEAAEQLRAAEARVKGVERLLSVSCNILMMSIIPQHSADVLRITYAPKHCDLLDKASGL